MKTLYIIIILFAFHNLIAKENNRQTAKLESLKQMLQQQKLIPSNGDHQDEFATSFSISGNQVIIGAPYAGSNDKEYFGTGLAYIYELISGTWQQKAVLMADDATKRSRFGRTVAIDGNRALVSATFKNIGSKGLVGKVYEFEKISGIWSQVNTISATVLINGQRFGSSIQLSGDITYIAALGEDNGSNSLVGSVYVLEKQGNSWVETAHIVPDSIVDNSAFGNKIIVHNNLLYIASYGIGTIKGKVFVYENQAGTWTKIHEIQATDVEAGDRFGYDISIDGNNLLISSLNDSHTSPTALDAGSVYLFEYNNNSWTQTHKFIANDASDSDKFGYSVSINANQILIGAPSDDDNGINTGSVYVYNFSNNQWNFLMKLHSVDNTEGGNYGNAIHQVGINSWIGSKGAEAFYLY